MDIPHYTKKIFEIKTEDEFNNLSLRLFNYQYHNNSIYKQYIDLNNINIANITHYLEIPFLPIELFRTHKIILDNKKIDTFFMSSGTTNYEKSRHYISDISIYKESILKSFKLFVGNPKDFVFFCLVPDFPNHPNSSLSFMCNELIEISGDSSSGFYLRKDRDLSFEIKECQNNNKKFIILGLSFEILSFAENNNINLSGGYVIQTGGTKKKDQHMIQEDLHNKLKNLLKIEKVYSEYGMAELLSQSYYLDNCFQSPPWKKIIIRDKTNPFRIIQSNKRGCINIIDLANIYSCSFIATNDLGHVTETGFNILGRAQYATEKGCSLMT
tara:strand:- start:700 stop:1680 length:981 start_codon:yes stop_codon:yes gene_type:complete